MPTPGGMMRPVQNTPNWRAVGAAQWPRWRRHIRRVTASKPPVEATAVMAGGATDFPGGGVSNYRGGVLLPDGRVFCVPGSATQPRIYNPATNTVSLAGAPGSFPGSQACLGGVLLRDGRVFCIPAPISVSARIYDPSTDLVSVSSAVNLGTSNGGCLLRDGRVFLVSSGTTSSVIGFVYDPATDTIAYAGGGAVFSGTARGGVLMADGRVFCVPNSATQARVYDPETDTGVLVGSADDFPGSAQACSGGVLLPDGRVVCVPGSTQANSTQRNVRIYSPATNAVVLVPLPDSIPAFTAAFHGGVLLPDGRVFFVPSTVGNVIVVFDPISSTFEVTTPSMGLTAGSSNLIGGVLLPDGRVFCVPGASPLAIVYGGGRSFDRNFLLSTYVNKY